MWKKKIVNAIHWSVTVVSQKTLWEIVFKCHLLASIHMRSNIVPLCDITEYTAYLFKCKHYNTLSIVYNKYGLSKKNFFFPWVHLQYNWGKQCCFNECFIHLDYSEQPPHLHLSPFHLFLVKVNDSCSPVSPSCSSGELEMVLVRAAVVNQKHWCH